MIKTSHKIGAAAVGAMMLTSGLVGAGSAWAVETYETGTISVTPDSAQKSGVQYDIFQIFKAHVDANGKAAEIVWASPAVQAAVEGAIEADAGTWTAEDQQADPTHVAGQSKYTGTTAQDAADYINAHINADTDPGKVGASGFAEALARAMRTLSADATLSASTDPAYTATLDEGYVLALSKSGTYQTATAPIFQVINHDAAVSITEKTSVPTVDKKVKEGSAWGATNDAEIGEAFDLKLTGTLPSNYSTYATYRYQFTDTLASSMDLVMAGDSFAESDIIVKIDGTEVSTDSFAATYANHVLTVNFADLKVAKDAENTAIATTSDSVITVEYQAELNGTAVVGSTGNENKVQLKYSNDPQTDGTGDSEEQKTHTYTYQLDVVKVNKNDETEKVAGVTFGLYSNAACTTPIKVTASGNVYTVAPDADAADVATITTDTNGEFSIKGLDEGDYWLKELSVPTDYRMPTVDTFKVTITSALNSDAYDTTQTATFDGAIDNAKYASITAVSAADGTVDAKITNDKLSDLPATGQNIALYSMVAGAIFIGAGIVIGLRRSRKNSASELED